MSARIQREQNSVIIHYCDVCKVALSIEDSSASSKLSSWPSLALGRANGPQKALGGGIYETPLARLDSLDFVLELASSSKLSDDSNCQASLEA